MESIDKKQQKLDKLYTLECLQHQILALPVPFPANIETFLELTSQEDVKYESTYGLFSQTANTNH